MLRLLAILLALPLAVSPHSAGDNPRATLVSPTGFQIKRIISLTIGHSLGAAEAKRRATERFASLQKQFAGVASESSMVWNGNTADVRVVAYGQPATAQVIARNSTLEIHVVLPIILAAVGGNIQDFLNKTAIDTLKP